MIALAVILTVFTLAYLFRDDLRERASRVDRERHRKAMHEFTVKYRGRRRI